MPNTDLLFYHAPNTRSVGIRILLEELAAPHTLCPLNLTQGEQRQPDYLAINPMGKVPAIVHKGELITEQVAIFIYLADAFQTNALAPQINAPLRGTYLRWMVYYSSCFEPAIIDKALERDGGEPNFSPYGNYDRMLKVITDQLSNHKYILGDHFCAADILWATALRWTTLFKLVPELPVISEYVARIHSRASFIKVAEQDAQLAKVQSEHEKNKAN